MQKSLLSLVPKRVTLVRPAAVSDALVIASAKPKIKPVASPAAKEAKKPAPKFGIKLKDSKKTAEKEFSVDEKVSTKTVEPTLKQSDNTERMLAQIRGLRSKLPSSLGQSLFKIVYLPIVPIFSNFNLADPKLLNAAGFKTFHLGSELDGYPVLADQAILIIDYDKVDQLQMSLEKEDIDERRPEHKQALKEYKEKLAAWEEEGDEKIPKPVRPAPLSRPKGIARDDMSEIVIQLTKDMKEQFNVDYVLMSTEHRNNPKNNKLVCFWLAERWKVRKLDRSGRASVEQWDFAFA